jgi:plasmid stability protein
MNQQQEEQMKKLTIREMPASILKGMDLRAGINNISREQMVRDLLISEFSEEARLMEETERQAKG